MFHNSAWPELELEESSNSADREVTSELEDPSGDEGQHADLEFSGDSWNSYMVYLENRLQDRS